MLYTKSVLCVIAVSLVFLCVAASLIQSGNFGKTRATELSLQQLADDGPGSNAFVRLADHSVAGEPVLVQRGKRDNFYIPLFTNVADSNADTPIRVVLRIDSTKSDQLPAIQKQLTDPNTRIEGLCYQQLGKTADHLFIEKQHERSAFGAHVILYHSTPEFWELFLGLAIIAIVYAFYVLSTLLICKSSGNPRTRSDRISMMVTGTVAVVVGGFLYYQNATEFIFATVGLTFAGLGLARLIVGTIALKIEDHLFTGNWFLGNNIACGDEVFSLRSGRKQIEVPVDDIESIGLVWYEDGHQHIDRNQFSLRLITAEKKFRINGLILRSEFLQYSREFNLLYQHLESRFWNQLMEGNECSGDGWRLSAEMLCLNQKRSEDLQIPIGSLEDVREIEGEVRFWVRGNETHVAALSIEKLNAELLSRCLNRLKQLQPTEASIAESPASSFNQSLTGMQLPGGVAAPVQPQTGLGIIKFSEKANRTTPFWSILLLAVGILCCCFGQWFLGLVCTFAGLYQLTGLLQKRSTLQVHENGVSLKRGDDIETLAFEEMESVTFKVDRKMNGTHWEGNCFDLEFAGGSGDQRKSICFQTPASVSDVYSNLIEKASKTVAEKMAGQLHIAEKVEWVPGCFLWKDGLEAPFGSLIKGEARKIGFDLLGETKVKNDRLRIYANGKMTAAFVLESSQENFMPGYMLFLKLVELSKHEAAEMNGQTDSSPSAVQ